MKKKVFGAGMIMLLICVAIAPSINANVSSLETVEFTTEVCGLNGGKQTVQLTKAEAEEVEALFDSIRAQLNNTETREEAEEVFKEAVVELDKYGLLGGLSVKQAQRLVTGGYQNSRVMKVLEKMSNRHKGIFNNSNFLCLIAGFTGNTFFQSPLGRIQTPLLLFLLTPRWWNLFIYDFYTMFITMFLVYEAIIWSINPLPLGYEIGLGYMAGSPDGTYYVPANGWVFTLGLNGIKYWNGSFFGNIPFSPIISFYYEFFSGILGFTGIKLSNVLLTIGFYLGGALWVKIGDKHP